MCYIDPIYHVYLPLLLKVLTGLLIVFSCLAFILRRKRKKIDQLCLDQLSADGVSAPNPLSR